MPPNVSDQLEHVAEAMHAAIWAFAHFDGPRFDEMLRLLHKRSGELITLLERLRERAQS